MTHDTADELPDDVRDELLEGLALLAHKLREWRSYGSLHAVSAQVLNADGVFTVTCHPDDHLTYREGETTIDITELVDGTPCH